MSNQPRPRSFRREDCRLCGATDLELVLQLAPTPPGDHYFPAERLTEVQPIFPLNVLLCCACGQVQLREVVDPDVLYRNYIYRTSISRGLAEHYRRYVDDVLRCVAPPDGALVIDVGSNDGTLLRCFQECGFRVLGVDPAQALAVQVTRSGIDTVPAFFTARLARDLRREHGAAHVITANNVIANIDDLNDLLDGVRSLLAPNGVFVFETGYVVDLVKDTLLDNIYHEHLSYFSARPLEAFFRRRGMELIDVRRVETKGGSLRGMVQPAGRPRAAAPSVGELIALEATLGVDRPEGFKVLAERCERARDEVGGFVRDVAGRGTVVAYGASVGVTTLIYHFGLGGVLRFIVDDNASRHGLFSPGYHIPVLPPRALYRRKPDCVLVLAWRYAEPIIGKHTAFLEQGGRFVVPLPELRVYEA